MKKVKWIFPEREDDYQVHFLRSGEYSLCGLAYEGVSPETIIPVQGFKETKERVSCGQCIEIVNLCKKVRKEDYE